MFDYSMVGAGLGLLPTLLKLLRNGQSLNNDNAGATDTTGIPIQTLSQIAPGADAAVGPDGIRNPISGPMQPGARLDAVGNPLTPGVMQPIRADYQNPLPSPDTIASNNTGSMDGLSSALSGLGKSLGGGGPTNTPGGAPYQPPQVSPPNYAGTGPNAALLQSSGGIGMNPLLLAFLKSRLANAGGGGL